VQVLITYEKYYRNISVFCYEVNDRRLRDPLNYRSKCDYIDI